MNPKTFLIRLGAELVIAVIVELAVSSFKKYKFNKSMKEVFGIEEKYFEL